MESRSQFKTGLVNHAFAAALRALLLVGFCVSSYLLYFHLIEILIMFLSPVSGLYAALLKNQRAHCSSGLSFFLLLETGYVGLDLKHVILNI